MGDPDFTGKTVQVAGANVRMIAVDPHCGPHGLSGQTPPPERAA
jgi:hypothetical protein